MRLNKTKTKPKISVNKLGEYLDASARRRAKIVKDQKYPNGFVVTRYNPARSAIVDFFVNGKGDKGIVSKKIEKLILASYNTTFQEQDNRLSIEALKIFSKTEIGIDLEAVDKVRTEKNLNKLPVSGVDVSIHPDVLIFGKMGNEPFVGAIKIHISKSNVLTEKAGRYVSVMLHQFLEETYPKKKVKPNFCITLDIFKGEYFVAPKAYKMLREDIEHACREIEVMWKSI